MLVIESFMLRKVGARLQCREGQRFGIETSSGGQEEAGVGGVGPSLCVRGPASQSEGPDLQNPPEAVKR